MTPQHCTPFIMKQWRYLAIAVICVIVIMYFLSFFFQDFSVNTAFVKPSFSHRLILQHNITRSSCTCQGHKLAEQVPKDNYSAVVKRRLEEYKQFHIRMTTDFKNIILAPSNSPLQYPIHGFTVSPMKKSVIPGLALHAEKRTHYKVTLRVHNGTLFVNNDLEEVQVEEQGKNTLTISTTNLEHLNNLLSGVVYTSTVYFIRAHDMVSFIFEHHEATFPITIQRPRVPVLYDPGNDINSQVTVATKTFLRYNELKVLIDSIRRFYPDIKIIVADDSHEPEKVTGANIEHYIMPPAQGWFAGRNLVVSQVTTKYFLWVDDDFVFLNKTSIEKFVKIMEDVPELDVLGGDVDGNQFFFSLFYEEGDEEGGCLMRHHNKWHSPLPGHEGCYLVDGVVNFFLARTDAVRKVGFDPFLKRVAHTEFFIDGLGDLLVASCRGLSVGHQKRVSHHEYSKYRTQKSKDSHEKLVHHFFKNHLKCIKY